jgi:hypothetical protein
MKTTHACDYVLRGARTRCTTVREQLRDSNAMKLSIVARSRASKMLLGRRQLCFERFAGEK